MAGVPHEEVWVRSKIVEEFRQDHPELQTSSARLRIDDQLERNVDYTEDPSRITDNEWYLFTSWDEGVHRGAFDDIWLTPSRCKDKPLSRTMLEDVDRSIMPVDIDNLFSPEARSALIHPYNDREGVPTREAVRYGNRHKWKVPDAHDVRKMHAGKKTLLLLEGKLLMLEGTGTPPKTAKKIQRELDRLSDPGMNPRLYRKLGSVAPSTQWNLRAPHKMTAPYVAKPVLRVTHSLRDRDWIGYLEKAVASRLPNLEMAEFNRIPVLPPVTEAELRIKRGYWPRASAKRDGVGTDGEPRIWATLMNIVPHLDPGLSKVDGVSRAVRMVETEFDRSSPYRRVTGANSGRSLAYFN